MKFTLIAASSLLKHSTQKAPVAEMTTAHERALMILNERAMMLKEPLENMMQSVQSSLSSISLPTAAQLQSLQLRDCQEFVVRLFQEPMHSPTAIAINALLVVLLVLWVVTARKRQDKMSGGTMSRSPSFSMEKKESKKALAEREARWTTLLQKRPVNSTNSEAMSAWLMEVLAVSDMHAPLVTTTSRSSNSNNKPPRSMSMPPMASNKQHAMPFVNTWNPDTTTNNEEHKDGDEQDPGTETSC
jgi:hypothetical protein